MQHEILPLADALSDIHSGGKTMMFSPFACYHRIPDRAVLTAVLPVLSFPATNA